MKRRLNQSRYINTETSVFNDLVSHFVSCGFYVCLDSYTVSHHHHHRQRISSRRNSCKSAGPLSILTGTVYDKCWFNDDWLTGEIGASVIVMAVGFCVHSSWFFICLTERKKKGNSRDVTSHLCAQTHCDTLISCALEIFLLTYLLTYRHPHRASPPTCDMGRGSGRSQPCSVLSKLFKGFWLPEGLKSAIFLCLALWLI